MAAGRDAEGFRETSAQRGGVGGADHGGGEAAGAGVLARRERPGFRKTGVDARGD